MFSKKFNEAAICPIVCFFEKFKNLSSYELNTHVLHQLDKLKILQMNYIHQEYIIICMIR